MASDLEWAVDQARHCLSNEYRVYSAYYEGDHMLAFATEKFRNTFGNVFREFAENMCAPVVDSLSDRLQITGFRSSLAELKVDDIPGEPAEVPGMPPRPSRKKVTVVDPLGEQCLAIWQNNRMDERSAEVHTGSLKLGDSYVIVWPNNEMEPEIWPQEGYHCRVQYDSDNRKKVNRALKLWFDEDEDRWRLNVYTELSILKYQARGTNYTLPSTEAGWTQIDYVSNPYLQVPVFHFPNRRSRRYGISELKDVIPLQNALNKSVLDMMIAMEFASFKQRYVIGLDLEIDEETGEPRDPNAKNYGVDRLLAFADPETKVGQFDATDLGQFLEVQEKFWASTARISGTPLHYFFITSGDFPSGEAMKAAEARFVKKISDRQTAYGNIWEDVLKFCLKVKGEQVAPEVTIATEWVDPAPRTEAELADTAVKKQAVGVSRSQILKELGYTDEEIARMLEESDADAERKASLAKQPTPPEEGGVKKPLPARSGPPGRGKGVPR